MSTWRTVCFALVAGIGFLAAASCSYRVSPSDVVGKWEMSEDNARFLNLDGVPRIQLLPDGQLQADCFPMRGYDAKAWSCRKDTGQWKISEQRASQVEISFRTREVLYQSYLYFEPSHPGWAIVAWDGEPGDRPIYFVRVQ